MPILTQRRKVAKTPSELGKPSICITVIRLCIFASLQLCVNVNLMPIYDKFAERYDTCFAPLERIGLSRYRKETLSLLPRDAAILELGCGTGANFEFYPSSQTAISTELSFEMIKRAKHKRRENILVNADAQQLPFAESVFDAAFATLVFCSIPQPERAFAELKRVIKPGGRVILLEHVRPDGILGPVFDGLNAITARLAEDHFNRRTAETAEACGLTIIEVRKKMAGIVNLIVCQV
jgi:ubiquinone/menaquinone biosynthesis C-methylase UbiE